MIKETKKVLVTGATGMLGSHLTYELVNKGYTVSAVKRKNSDINNTLKILSFYSKDYKTLFENINWINADLCDYGQTEDAVADNEYIFHTAAMVSFNRSKKQKVIDTNINTTANIVNACLKNKTEKLCHVSSIAAVGASQNGKLISEDDQKENFKKSSAYSISKIESEMEVWRGISEGLNAVIVNPSVILGPGNWNSGSPAIFKAVADGINFYTNGINGFVDVRDVAEIMIKLTEADIQGERFILNSENISYRELFTMIAQSLNKKPPSIEATKAMLYTASIFEKIKYLVLKSEARITKDTIKSALGSHSYSNEKILNFIDHKFTPVNSSIIDFCKIYLDNLKL